MSIGTSNDLYYGNELIDIVWLITTRWHDNRWCHDLIKALVVIWSKALTLRYWWILIVVLIWLLNFDELVWLHDKDLWKADGLVKCYGHNEHCMKQSPSIQICLHWQLFDEARMMCWSKPLPHNCSKAWLWFWFWFLYTNDLLLSGKDPLMI